MLLGALFYDLIIPMDSCETGFRLGDFSGFGRGTWANSRSLTAEIGIVTYNDDDEYEVSSYTIGARCDHATNALLSVLGDKSPRESVNQPLDNDSEILIDKDTRTIYREDGVDVDLKARDEERKALEVERKRLAKEHDAEMESIRKARSAETADA